MALNITSFKGYDPAAWASFSNRRPLPPSLSGSEYHEEFPSLENSVSPPTLSLATTHYVDYFRFYQDDFNECMACINQKFKSLLPADSETLSLRQLKNKLRNKRELNDVFSRFVSACKLGPELVDSMSSDGSHSNKKLSQEDLSKRKLSQKDRKRMQNEKEHKLSFNLFVYLIYFAFSFRKLQYFFSTSDEELISRVFLLIKQIFDLEITKRTQQNKGKEKEENFDYFFPNSANIDFLSFTNLIEMTKISHPHQSEEEIIKQLDLYFPQNQNCYIHQFIFYVLSYQRFSHCILFELSSIPSSTPFSPPFSIHCVDSDINNFLFLKSKIENESNLLLSSIFIDIGKGIKEIIEENDVGIEKIKKQIKQNFCHLYCKWKENVESVDNVVIGSIKLTDSFDENLVIQTPDRNEERKRKTKTKIKKPSSTFSPSTPPSTPTATNEPSFYHTVYVKNFPSSIKNEDNLRDIFIPFGEITSIFVPRNNNNELKGFALVSFSSADAASSAVTTLHGSVFFENEKPLYVRPHKNKKDREEEIKKERELERKKETPKKKKNLKQHVAKMKTTQQNQETENQNQEKEKEKNNSSLPDDFSSIHAFLSSLSLLDCEPIFIKEEISIDVLFSLTADDLKEIGLKLGPRKKILTAIMERKQLNEKTTKIETKIDYETKPKTDSFFDFTLPPGSSYSSYWLEKEKMAEQKEREIREKERKEIQQQNTPYQYREINYNELKLDPNPIGKGAFGVVFKANWRGAEVAVKRLLSFFDEKQIDLFRKEAELMHRVNNHPHIVNFCGCVSKNGNFCLVTDFCKYGSLYDLQIKNKTSDLSLLLIVRMLRDAASGILHLHKENIIHRDIASRNILVGNHYNIFVSDFGLSRVKTDSYDHTLSNIGPVRWMSPEAISKKRYSEYSDAYSFGVLIWEVLHKSEPYKGIETFHIASGVVNGTLELKIDQEPILSPYTPLDLFLVSLMKECFSYEPKERPKFDKIFHDLNDWYLQKLDQEFEKKSN